MFRNSEVARAVRRTLLMSAVATASAASLTAYAQDQDQDADITTVTVTGSRISAPNLESISPVTAITNEDIVATGKVRVEDIVNQLPQAFAAQGSTISNGATGIATVDLRGLGAKRTLVLVNGRRLMPGNPDTSDSNNAGAADLNQIPAAMIERVEVLTGGASAVYGADAVGGVVNFIMNTEFEGVRFDMNYSLNRHENDNPAGDIVRTRGFALPEDNVSNGYTKDFSFIMGSNVGEDRGNVTFYATYRDVDAVLQSEYDYSACTFNSGAAFTCGGSSTSFPGRFLPVEPISGDFSGSFTLDQATGVPRNFAAATDQYNFGPLNYYQRPDERYTAGVFFNYDVAEKANVYSEFMFMNDRSVSQIAPSGSFLSGYTFECANPLWTQAQRTAFCGSAGLDASPTSTDTVDMLVGRRNVEGGGRQQDIEHESYRVILGVRGDITNAWTYDAYGQIGETSLAATYLNDFSIQRSGRALDIVRDPMSGQPVCRSVVDGTDANCVPWNIWAPNGVTPAALNYLQIPLVQTGETEQRVVSASFTGNLGEYGIKLPTTDTGLFVNVGVEWRQEGSSNLPDASYQAGDGAGQGGATLPISGGYTVRELFTEVRIPIAQDAAFAQSLSAEAGYRYSEYSLDFSTDTYKAGLEWSPIDDVRTRASFQRAVRVPNVAELYSTQQVGLRGTVDVCAGAAPQLSAEQCARTGVTAARYRTILANPAAQYNGFIGGNTTLQPETADTVSFGVAFQPRFIEGLRLQVDYFDIKIDDPVQNPNADFTLLQCARTGDPALCSKVRRDPLFQSLWLATDGFVIDTLENIGELRTSGIDFDASYQFRIGELGRMKFDFVGTLLDKLEYTPQTGVTYDCAGLYGGICLVPAPEWRHKFDAVWSAPWGGLDIGLAWRYFDEVGRDAEDSNEFLNFLGQVTGVLPTDSTLGSRSYLDLTAAMTFKDAYTFRLGINNLTDKDPPLSGADTCPTGPCNGNTWPQMYDTLGRQIFATLTVNF